MQQDLTKIKEMTDQEWSEFSFKENTRRTFKRMKEFSRQLTDEDLIDEPTALANSSYREELESDPRNILASSISSAINSSEEAFEEYPNNAYMEIHETLKELRVKLNNIKQNG
jgi:hypothetical protein